MCKRRRGWGSAPLKSHFKNHLTSLKLRDMREMNSKRACESVQFWCETLNGADKHGRTNFIYDSVSYFFAGATFPVCHTLHYFKEVRLKVSRAATAVLIRFAMIHFTSNPVGSKHLSWNESPVQRGVSNTLWAAASPPGWRLWAPRSRRWQSVKFSLTRHSERTCDRRVKVRGRGERESAGGRIPRLNGLWAVWKMIPTSNGRVNRSRIANTTHSKAIKQVRGGKEACGVWACLSGRVKAERSH